MLERIRLVGQTRERMLSGWALRQKPGGSVVLPGRRRPSRCVGGEM